MSKQQQFIDALDEARTALVKAAIVAKATGRPATAAMLAEQTRAINSELSKAIDADDDDTTLTNELAGEFENQFGW